MQEDVSCLARKVKPFLVSKTLGGCLEPSNTVNTGTLFDLLCICCWTLCLTFAGAPLTLEQASVQQPQKHVALTGHRQEHPALPQRCVNLPRLLVLHVWQRHPSLAWSVAYSQRPPPTVLLRDYSVILDSASPAFAFSLHLIPGSRNFSTFLTPLFSEPHKRVFKQKDVRPSL